MIHFFTKTDKLRSFIYDVQQEVGGNENFSVLQMITDNVLGEGVSFFWYI